MAGLIRGIISVALVASFAACSTVGTSGVKNTSKTFKTVIVDAGHGGKDSGAYRRYGPPEKMVTLDVAQRLDQKLHESQIKTVMTRDSDVFIPLNDRVATENKQKNAIFVSIHFNDSRKRGTRGFETYYHSVASLDLANRIQQELMTIPNSANGGVHTANFWVLRLASCPAVLVECGYLSNRSEGNQARDWEYANYSRTELSKQSSSSVTEQESISPLLKSLPNCARRSIPPTAAPASRQLARGRVRDRQLKFFSAVFGPDSGKEN